MSKSEQQGNTPALVEQGSSPPKTKISIEANYWEGSLPHPDILNKYDLDTRHAIIAMAKEEQNHRHKRLDKGQRERSKARNFGFVIALVSLVGGLYLIDTGKIVVPTVLILTAISELVSALVFTWSEKIRGKAKTTGQT